MASAGLLPQPSDDDSALGSLLGRLVDHDKIGAVISKNLLQFGLFGSAVVIVTGLVALAMPGADSISHSKFYLLFGGAVAELVTFMRALAGPAMIFAGVLLILDAVLLTIRTAARWHSIIVLQATAGGLGGTLATVFLAMFILNLVIWVVLAALVLMALGALLAVLVGGS